MTHIPYVYFTRCPVVRQQRSRNSIDTLCDIKDRLFSVYIVPGLNVNIRVYVGKVACVHNGQEIPFSVIYGLNNPR